jgi:hypothetical protein
MKLPTAWSASPFEPLAGGGFYKGRCLSFCIYDCRRREARLEQRKLDVAPFVSF